jgi:hypothetical protein
MKEEELREFIRKAEPTPERGKNGRLTGFLIYPWGTTLKRPGPKWRAMMLAKQEPIKEETAVKKETGDQKTEEKMCEQKMCE